jgi:hypothetical protein
MHAWWWPLAILLLGCSPALPPDLRTLAERTTQIEVKYEGTSHGPLFERALKGSADFGDFRLSSEGHPRDQPSFEMRVEERGRTVAMLQCLEFSGALLSDPPQYFRSFACRNETAAWRFEVDLGDTVVVRAQTQDGLYFLTPPLVEPAPADDPSKAAVKVFRVHEGGPPDANNHREPQRLAAAVAIAGSKVILLVPSSDPTRTMMISAFLVLLASRSPERLHQFRVPVVRGL